MATKKLTAKENNELKTLAQALVQANAPAEKSKPEVCPSSVHAKALAVFKADGALHKADGAIVFAMCALLESANEAGAIESDAKRAAVITDLKAVYKTMPTVAAKRARVIQQAAYIAYGRAAKRKADGSFSEAMEAQGWEVVQECFKVSATLAALAKALTACMAVTHGAVGKVKPKGDKAITAAPKGADAPLVLPGKADAAKAALITILSAYQNTFTVASKDGKLIAAIDTTMQLLKAA